LASFLNGLHFFSFLLDFSELWPQDARRQERADVLNGISISKDDGVLYVTGKNWNRMHKVKLTGF